MRKFKVNKKVIGGGHFILNKYYILILFAAFLISIGSTYAYFTYQVTSNTSVITGKIVSVNANLKVELVVGNNNSMVPLKDEALGNALIGKNGAFNLSN